MSTSLNQLRSQLAPIATVSSGFFSVSEAAAMTKTGEETIRRAIRDGRIPAYGARGRLRIRLSDLMRQYVPRGNAARA